MANTKTTSFRLSNEDLKKLDELSIIYQIDRTTLIKRYIEQDYLRVSKVGKKKVTRINEQMKSIIDNLSELLSEGDHI